MSKKFNKLTLSPHWQQYFSKYPQGYTIIENLIDWVSQVDDMVDNQNDLNETVETYGNRLDEFIGQYDTHLQETVEQTLSDWQNSGFLNMIINQTLDTKYHEMDNRLTSQLAQTERELDYKKIDRNSGDVGKDDLSQELKEIINGDRPLPLVEVGSILRENIVHNQITKNHLVFPPARASKPSTNLFNIDSVVRGKYVRVTDGTIGNNVTFAHSDYIYIGHLEQVTVRFLEQVAFYDIDKTFVTGLEFTGWPSATIDVPENAHYIIINTSEGRLNTQQVNAGNKLLPYETGYPKITSEDIDKKAVNPENTTFFEKSTNLFDKNSVVTGKYVRASDGTFGNNASFSHSDYTEINDTHITVRACEQVAFYTDSYDFVSGYESSTHFTTATIEVPSTAKFVIINTTLSRLNSQQLNEGNELLPYEEYGLRIPPRHLKLENIFSETNFKTVFSLSSKIVTGQITQIKLLGDSITHGVGGTGFSQDGEQIGTSDYYTSPNSVSWGNMLRDYLYEKFDTSVKNWGATGRDSAWVNQLKEQLIEPTDDLIILMIGTNDRNTGKGSLQDYMSRLKSIVNYVKEQGKEIILLSSVPASVSNEADTERTFHMEDVDNAIMSVSASFNQEYISLYKRLIEHCNYKNIEIDSLLADGLHPNDSGYGVMFNIVLQELGFGIKRKGSTW